MTISHGMDRVMFVHAHPDDETLVTGALIAHLRGTGVPVAVVTATRGERGEIVSGVLPSDTTPEKLVAHRERELTAALEVLGVTEHAWLGQPPALAAGEQPRIYGDSGMRWVRPGLAGPAADAPEDSFSRVPLQRPVDDLLAHCRHWRPSLLMSYDAQGGYGHPDHVRAREVTLAAARRLQIPVAEILTGDSIPDDGSAQVWDLEDTRPTVAQALRCHASQLTVHDDCVVQHVGGQREPLVSRVALRLVVEE